MEAPKKKRRWLRRLVLVLLLLLLLPVLLVGGALLYVSTEAGAELVRLQVLETLGESFAGRIDASKVELSGNHLVLHDVKLFTPEGELVAFIPRLETDVDFAALANDTIALSALTLRAPELHLQQDERGLNLARVFTAKTPSPDSGPSPWTVQLSKLDVQNGALDFTQGETRVETKALNVRGDLALRLADLNATGALALDAHVTGPLDEQLTVKLDAKGATQHLDAALGDTRFRGDLDVPKTQVAIAELTVTPKVASAFVPAYPLKTDVHVTGTASTSAAALHLTSGGAQIDTSGMFDLSKHTAQQFHLKGTGVDLKELLGAELPSQLRFEADGALTDTRLETLTGTIAATADWADQGHPLATLALDAKAENGVFKVPRAQVSSPGAEVTLQGSATRERVDLSGVVIAKDLSKVDETLQRFAHVDTGGLSGTGVLTVHASGAPKTLAVKAVGGFKKLRVATVAIGSLDVDADLPDLSQPQHTDIMLRAKQVQLGERQLEEVTFDFYTYKGRRFDLDLTTKGLGDLKLNVTGTLEKDNTGAQLDTAALTWTGSSWQLEAPTHASWKRGFEVDDFALRDGAQRISGRALWTSREVDVALDTTQLELSKLPHVLAPPSLGLAGALDLKVTITGTPKKPDATFHAALAQGALEGVDGIALEADGTWRDDRAGGTLKVSSPVGTLNGTFDLPVFALLDEKPEPATAHLTLDNVALSQVAQKLGRELPATGQLSATLDVRGTGKALEVTATVESPELQLTQGERKLSLRQPTLRAQTQADGTLMATVTASALGGQHRVTLTTPLTLSGLRRSPPTRDALLSTPVTVDFSLAEFSPLARHAKSRNGAMTVTGTLTGPARAPQGAVKLVMHELALEPLRKLDGEVTLRLEPSRLALTGACSVEKLPAFDLDAALEAPAAKFIEPLLDARGADGALAALETTPLKVSAKVPQLDLARAWVNDEEVAPPTGQLSGTLTASGTLEALRVNLDAAIAGAGFDKVKLENARVRLQATTTEQHLNVVMGSNHHDLVATAHTGVDLRPSSFRAGLKWRDAPVTASLEAHAFDLAFLSGVTDAVRAIEGQLDLKGTVNGTLGAPRFAGDAKLDEGRVALAGNGDYRHIALKLHATNDLLDLETLSAKAGAGSAELSARAERQPSGLFALTSTGSTEKFPIVSDDQLMAIATLNYSLDGEVSSTLADLRELHLPSVKVELPDVKRKDLQDLQRPKDVIVVRASDRRRKKPKADESSEPAKPGFMVRAVLVAPRNLWVKSSDVNIELGLSDGFLVEYQDELRLRGEARIKKGSLNVIGREFTINPNSEVRFAGLATQPYVNVSALHVNQREEVKITVSVAGKGTDVALKTTSEPPMPESDLYAILATGRRTLRQGGGNTITPGQAASVVGQLAASQLKTVIAKKLPLDVLNFETGDEFKNVKLDVGWYLNDVLYLGGTMNIGANRDRGENVWGGRLEWQMTRTLSLEGYAGDAPSYGADVMFSREF